MWGSGFYIGVYRDSGCQQGPWHCAVCTEPLVWELLESNHFCDPSTEVPVNPSSSSSIPGVLRFSLLNPKL